MSSIWGRGKNRSLEYLCILKFWCFSILFYDVFYVKSAVKRLRHLYQKIVYADHGMGSRFRDLSNSFHQNDIIEGRMGRPDRGVLSENNTHIGKVNISHLWWYDRVLTPDFEEGAVCVRSYWSRVSTIQPQPGVLSSYKPHQSSYLILTSRLSAHVTTFFGALSDILGTKTLCEWNSNAFNHLVLKIYPSEFYCETFATSPNLFMPCSPPPAALQSNCLTQIFPRFSLFWSRFKLAAGLKYFFAILDLRPLQYLRPCHQHNIGPTKLRVLTPHDCSGSFGNIYINCTCVVSRLHLLDFQSFKWSKNTRG